MKQLFDIPVHVGSATGVGIVHSWRTGVIPGDCLSFEIPVDQPSSTGQKHRCIRYLDIHNIPQHKRYSKEHGYFNLYMTGASPWVCSEDHSQILPPWGAELQVKRNLHCRRSEGAQMEGIIGCSSLFEHGAQNFLIGSSFGQN